MDDRTMGQRIAAERKKLGISQEQLGEKTGVSRQVMFMPTAGYIPVE